MHINKSWLASQVDAKAKDHGLTRTKIIQAVSYSFLFNRAATAEWVNKTLEFFGPHSTRQIIGYGNLRERLEDYELNAVPPAYVNDWIDTMWLDGTGEWEIDNAVEWIYKYAHCIPD